MKKSILLVCLAVLISCGPIKVVPDPVPYSTIDAGYPRVETEICGVSAVGENGCVFPDGKVSGKMRIFKAYGGSISITGEGCRVDRNFQYTYDPKNQWIELDLVSLVGTQLTSDCVLNLYQFINYPGGDQATFPISGIYGVVTLGTCPNRAHCSFSGETIRAGWQTLPLGFSDAQGGQYVLRGCGTEIVPTTAFQGGVSLDLNKLWPGGFPEHDKARCLFILGIKHSDGSTYKVYHKVTVFRNDLLMLNEPGLIVNGGKIDFNADSAVSLSVVGELALPAQAQFKASPDGDVMRFYTAQGRTLIVLVKDGAVIWAK